MPSGPMPKKVIDQSNVAAALDAAASTPTNVGGGATLPAASTPTNVGGGADMSDDVIVSPGRKVHPDSAVANPGSAVCEPPTASEQQASDPVSSLAVDSSAQAPSNPVLDPASLGVPLSASDAEPVVPPKRQTAGAASASRRPQPKKKGKGK